MHYLLFAEPKSIEARWLLLSSSIIMHSFDKRSTCSVLEIGLAIVNLAQNLFASLIETWPLLRHEKGVSFIVRPGSMALPTGALDYMHNGFARRPLNRTTDNQLPRSPSASASSPSFAPPARIFRAKSGRCLAARALSLSVCKAPFIHSGEYLLPPLA